MRTLQFQFEPEPPYDFARMHGRLRGVGHELYRHDENTLIRAIRVQGQVYLVLIRSEGETASPKLTVEAIPHPHNSGPNAECLAEVGAHLRRMLSIDISLAGLQEKLGVDDRLALLGRRYEGFRFILESDPFECMVKTIIGQQLNLSFAATLTRRLIEKASSPFEYKGAGYPVFPSPEQIASLQPEQLRELQFSVRKAEYVIDFARQVVAGTVSMKPAELAAKTNEQILTELTPLRGIGRWTVECFLMFGLGRPDLLPAADIGLRNALRQLYGLDHQPTEAEVRDLGRDWSPWSSYITYYLWESLNEKTLFT
ncbi:DNA-3-methyladenine glycosylase family protein [Paenibacillus koleovorans]|uniref:DNA-3-methyladenine glycosylase family protein n=1 Tax=Paenibacillus koleovorans TaxID=121608 RepID=UPI000FD990E8|nr:DNA-3-methyladenine glycosylase [Paenibacillus koleovorans]